MSKKSERTLLIARLYFRLLPVQILLLVVNAINGIVSGLFAANFIGPAAVGAIGLFGPINMLLIAIGTTFMGGSQILCGKYMGQNHVKKHRISFLWIFLPCF